MKSGRLMAMAVACSLFINGNAQNAVGIGTSTPAVGFKLDVVGNTFIEGNLKVGAAASYTLPGADGATNYILKTNGTGTVSWQPDNNAGGTVTSITASSPLTGGTITGSGTIGIGQATTSTSGYLSATDWNTFNNKLSSAVTSVATGTGLAGGTITSSGTISLANTAVGAGNYGDATHTVNFTVDAQGRLTSATSTAITGLLPAGTSKQTLYNNGSAWIATSNLSNDGTNIGIGTPSPTASLHIVSPNLGSTDATLRLSPIGGGTSTTGRPSLIDFWSTFDNFGGDQGPRRTASIKGQFSGGVWGNETLVFEVGGSGDASTEPIERMRIAGNGAVTISNLAGTGNRAVFADASGVLKADANIGTAPINTCTTSTGTGTVGAQTFSSTGAVAIPDASCTPGASNIAVSGYTGNVATANITCSVNISHTYDGDIELFLVAPNGDRLGLSNRNGGGGDNYAVTTFSGSAGTNIASGASPYNGTYAPQGSIFGSCTSSTISAFGAIGGGSYNPNGTWSLQVYDRAGSDVGTINSWSITFPAYTGTTTITTCADVPKIQRFIRGTVSLAGVLVSGGGYTITKLGTGLYSVNFTTAFSDAPSATVTQVTNNNGNDTRDNAFISTISSTAMVIATGDSGGAKADRSFSFIVMGTE